MVIDMAKENKMVKQGYVLQDTSYIGQTNGKIMDE